MKLPSQNKVLDDDVDKENRLSYNDCVSKIREMQFITDININNVLSSVGCFQRVLFASGAICQLNQRAVEKFVKYRVQSSCHL